MRDYSKSFHVRPHADGWAVFERGKAAPLGRFGTRDDAWAAALDVARRFAPAAARLRAPDGGIETERTFGPDLYPPVKGDEFFPWDYRSRGHETGFSLPPVREA